MHLALKYTFKAEENNQLPFLDVLVEKSNEEFLTFVFRKPTFTGQYLEFVGICLGLQNLKPTWLNHLCSEHWWLVWKVHCSMNWKASAPFYGIIETQKALFKSPCLRKLRFSTVNQKKDRKSVQFTWSSLGLAKFLWIWRANQSWYQPLLQRCWTSNHFYN